MKRVSRRILFGISAVILIALPSSAAFVFLSGGQRETQEGPPPADGEEIIEILDPSQVNPPISREGAVLRTTQLRSQPPQDAVIELIRNRAWSKIVWSVSWFEGDEPVTVTIDAYSNELIEFTDMASYIGLEDMIESPSVAIAYALSELQEKEIALDEPNATTVQAVLVDEPMGLVWWVEWGELADSRPVASASVSVGLDPNTCNATFIRNVWQDTTEIDTDPVITSEQAVSIARNALETEFGLPPDSPLISCQLLVKQTNEFWNIELPVIGDYVLMYVVVFQNIAQGGGYFMEAWIDAQTGNPVVGDMTL